MPLKLRKSMQAVSKGETGCADRGRIWILEREIYICPICGYTHVGSEPDKCPICGAPGKEFKKF